MTATDAAAPSLTDRLHFALQMLWKGVGRRQWCVRHTPLGAVLTLLNLWLGRTDKRFARLVALARAGRLVDLPPPAPRAPRAAPLATPGQPDARGKTQSARLPSRPDWLLKLDAPLPELAGCRASLEHLLADPDMLALIAQAPRRFGRVLRPLCRLTGALPPTPQGRRLLRLPWKHDPPEFRAACQPRRAPRIRKPKPEPEENLIWTPRGMLTPRQFRRSIGVSERILR
jgi:hypothetical protein